LGVEHHDKNAIAEPLRAVIAWEAGPRLCLRLGKSIVPDGNAHVARSDDVDFCPIKMEYLDYYF
jgi:hypothetical protein